MATPGETPRGKTTAEAIDRAERRARAVDLRAEGHTLREIADKLGVSVSTAASDIDRALSEVPADSVDLLRRLWGQRLDALLKAVWTSAMSGNLDAVDKAVKIADRAAKLYGLDAPQQISMSTTGTDIEQAVNQFMAAVAEPVAVAEEPAEQWEEVRSDD